MYIYIYIYSKKEDINKTLRTATLFTFKQAVMVVWYTFVICKIKLILLSTLSYQFNAFIQ